ncbi:MAG: polysaccharide biosynthesis C-terminal domain-containing protein [Solobacterium sp.]|nr:polysaccharide biosynthesis C-terminal domain-containing protein [Solobacterium sp.]
MARRRKSSVFTVGALSCTTGIFLATVSGLILCIPYVMLADSAQLSGLAVLHAFLIFVSRTFAASLPFGLMALCANYTSRNDYKTVLHLRLFTSIAMMIFACVLAVALAFGSQSLAALILGGAGDAASLAAVRNVLYAVAGFILLFAVLYLYRGFYQGMNEITVDERSQWINGLLSALCSAGSLAYIWFHRDAKGIMLYLIVGGAVLALLITIGFYVLFDRLKYPRIEAMAKAQLLPQVKKKKAIGELFAFTMPGFTVAILNGCILLINTVFFLPATQAAGMEAKDALQIYHQLQVHSAWIAEIPVLFACWLSSSQIPQIAEGVERRSEALIDRGVERIFGRFFYAAIPMLFTIGILAPQFYYVLYGKTAAETGAAVLWWAIAEGAAVAMAMISSWLMITLRFNQNSVFYTVIGLIVKIATFWFLLSYMGYAGAMASTILAVFTILFLSLSRVYNVFNVSYQRLFLQMGKMLAACLCMNGVFAIFKFFGLDGLHASRLLSAVHLLAMYAVAVPVYLFVTGMLKVPTQLFGKKKGKSNDAAG